MYAIIDTGNQQERVEVGTVIEVDYIADAKKGDKVKFDKVLLFQMERLLTLANLM